MSAKAKKSTKQKSFLIDKEEKQYVIKSIELFMRKEKDGFETRYKSWINCHEFFVGLHEKYENKSITFKKMSKTEQELAILHLSCYLASWGMYRGSSFILQYDNTIFEDVIDIIFKEEYSILWNLDFDEIKNNTSEIKNLLLKIGKEVSDALIEYRNFSSTKNFSYSKEFKGEGFYNLSKKEKEHISQTLVTKILLGTLCCCPAYDTFFSAGIGGTFNQFFDAIRLGNLLEKIKQNAVFAKYSKKTGYPLMKIVDMAYFNIGLEKDFKGYYDNYIIGSYVIEKRQWRKKDSWNSIVKSLKQFYFKLNKKAKHKIYVAFDCDQGKVDEFIRNNKTSIKKALDSLRKKEEKEEENENP